MTTGRELLALAAKAAGAKMSDYSDGTPDHWEIKHADGVWRKWDARNDDGDSRRLEVKLGFSVVRETIKVPIVGIVKSLHLGQLTAFRLAWEPIGSDPCAATRLAVLRAAAEIGKGIS